MDAAHSFNRRKGFNTRNQFSAVGGRIGILEPEKNMVQQANAIANDPQLKATEKSMAAQANSIAKDTQPQ